MDIALIVNTADQAALEQLRAAVGRLREEGHAVRAQATFEPGDARRMARDAAAGGADLVVAAGGDGTVNEVVNGLHEHAETAGGALPRLGIVPLGTGNDLAWALELPMEVEPAVRAAVGGRARELDVARVAGRCFLNVSTGGFGAEATEEASAEIKKTLGTLAYWITGARKFVALEVAEARFSDGEVIHDGPFMLFAVGNSRRTGGGNWLTPRADPSDGLLDVLVVRELSRMEFVKLLPELRNGSHLDHPAVIYRQVPRVVVEPATTLSVNVDGEPLPERARYEYAISPHRVRVMVP